MDPSDYRPVGLSTRRTIDLSDYRPVRLSTRRTTEALDYSGLYTYGVYSYGRQAASSAKTLYKQGIYMRKRHGSVMCVGSHVYRYGYGYGYLKLAYVSTCKWIRVLLCV